jgi:hypothetical protein
MIRPRCWSGARSSRLHRRSTPDDAIIWLYGKTRLQTRGRERAKVACVTPEFCNLAAQFPPGSRRCGPEW